MQPIISVKVDPRMKVALKKLADKQFITISSVIKQSAEKHLQENGIDWREESPEEDPAK